MVWPNPFRFERQVLHDHKPARERLRSLHCRHSIQLLPTSPVWSFVVHSLHQPDEHQSQERVHLSYSKRRLGLPNQWFNLQNHRHVPLRRPDRLICRQRFSCSSTVFIWGRFRNKRYRRNLMARIRSRSGISSDAYRR